MTVAHHRKYKIPHESTILLILIGTGLIAGGAISWTKFEQRQEDKIQQAQSQLTAACQTTPDSQIHAIEASRQVDESTNLLQNIPHVPGLGYRTAQEQLTFFAPCIQNVKAAEDFFAAKQLSQEAIEATGSIIYSVSQRRSLQADLKQAIALLHNIPESADIYTEAQKELQIYQIQLEAINQRLTYEAEADHAFATAERLYQTAQSILANSSDSEALSEAKTQLEMAVQWLEIIPPGHIVSDQAKENLTTYQQQLADIRYQQATSQLEAFIADFHSFTTSQDVTLTYHTYSEQLNRFNDRFYALKQDAPEILSHPAAPFLQKALEQENDAMSVWRYCHEGNCYTTGEAGFLDWRRELLWIPANFQIGDSSLKEAYPVPVRTNILGQSYVQQNLALSTIWETARQNVAAARDEI
jgi:hypothetical protein